MTRLPGLLAIALAAGSLLVGQESRPGAKAVVEDLRRLSASKRSADIWKNRAATRAALDAAGVPAALRDEGAKLILAAGLDVIGALAGFVGDVEIREKGLIEVRYDFVNGAFEKDFELAAYLPAAAAPTRERRTIRGNGVYSHRAIWAPDLRLDVAVKPLVPQDFGPVFLDPDDKEGERFLTGFHNNAYFGVKYEADRTVTAGHVLLLAGRGAVSKARTRPTQLLGRTDVPTIGSRTEVRASLSVLGGVVQFSTGTSPTSMGRLTFQLAPATQTFARTKAGLLIRDSELEIASISLSGRLDPVWDREETARLRASLAK